ncbi:PAS domain S-box protein [Geothrix oryzisoli]|uniref:PAS domain S-box protein n=1 Tax=Geothrix oryzisoli TaxID=2922721 RepID=UPI001FAD9250|nr:PAS domain S-box protein [Geothrix oryzisoli]
MTGPPLMQKVARRTILGLGLTICTVGLLALLGFVLETRYLAAISQGMVPMSPTAAVLVLVLGGALLLERVWPGSALLRRVARGLVLAGLCLGLAVVAWRLLGLVPVLGRWAIPGRPASLLTGLAISFSASSMLVRRRMRQVASLLAQVPLVIGTVVLISYAAGAPLLYESGLAPMSLPSAFCSVGFGLALMLAAGCDTWPLAVFGFVPGHGRGPRPLWFTTGPLALFLLLGVLVLSGGSFFLRAQLKATRTQVHTELSTIAEFKAHQIEAWMAERRAVADRVARGNLIQGAFRRFLAEAPGAPPEAQLRASMEDLQRGTYRRVVLFDRLGRVRISVPSGEAFSDEDRDASELQAALRSKEVMIRDLHQHPGKPDIHLSLWIPIGASSEPGSLAEGTLLLVMDPRTFLYPLVTSWPTASPSAETLLVRRGGDEILYLSEFRHRAQPALSLRLPLKADPSMPSALAARGQEGLVAGLDYRGEPVLAAIHQIRAMPWGMVTKVDEAEVYGPLRRRIWLGGIGLIGIVVIVAAGLGLMVRHHDAEMVRRQLNLSQRFEGLMRQANDIILLMDGEGRIREANARAVEHYGYSLAELQSMSAMDLRVTETHAEGVSQFARMKALGATRFETVHRRKDGSTFSAEVSAKVVDLGDEQIVVSFIRDVTERLAQQRELQRMTQLYAALSQVNQAIVWTSSREDLFARLCEALVKHGRFRMAWVGLDDPVTHQVARAAQCGDMAGYLDTLDVRSDDTPIGHGPMGTAIREGSHCVFNDYLGLPDSGAWREAAIRSGFASAAAFPIREGGQVIGALAVYAGEKYFFGVHEAELLAEAAMDVSYALDHLAGEARRREAEAALKKSERLLREAQEAGGVGTYTWDIGKDEWTSSPYLDRIFGIGPDYPRTLAGWTDLVPPGPREQLAGYVAGIIERRERFDLAYPIVRPSDGASRWVHGRGELHWDPEGRPAELVGVIQDITEQKEDEQALRKISVAMEQSPLSVVITDPRGTIEYVNPRFTQVTGYSAEEAIGQNPRLLKSPGTPSDVYTQMWSTLARGEVWVGEFANLTKEGRTFLERATIAPVRDEAGTLTNYIALKEDITEQRRVEAERRQLEAQLYQSQKLESLGSLAGGVAHDMNNVLGAILGTASILHERSDPSDRSARSLETIMSACLRGRDVVKSLLYFAHKDIQEERPVDLNGLIQEMSELLSHTVLKNIHLDVHLQEGLGLIRGDAGALSHALMNLCVNACDAMPDGGTLRLQTARTPEGGISLRVQDTGEGIAPDVLAKCMEPFFTTKPKGKGTGLGLSMVYGTMKAHEGSLELHSQVGQGTEAVLTFPASRVGGVPPEPGPAAPPAMGPGGQKILLVDDDDLFREALMQGLELLGHQPTQASEGQEALRLLEEGLPTDLVILDMNMPGMSGAQVLPRLLALRPGTPILVATGYSSDLVAPHMDGRPLVHSLRKPFSLKELQAKLAELLP